MADKPTVATLGDLLESLTKDIPYQQVRLNRDFNRRLRQFKKLYRLARGTGLETALRAIAPRPVTLDRVEVDASFFVESRVDQTVSLRVQPLNLGFTKRFAHSSHTENKLQILVQRVEQQPLLSDKPTEGAMNGHN
jgi:hypothetical protein